MTRMDEAKTTRLMAALLQEVQGLRRELGELRNELQVLRAAVPAPASAPPVPVASTPGQPSASTWLQRRNAERLAAEVQRRQAVQVDAGGDGDPDTDLDLLIDRLHDLALENGN